MPSLTDIKSANSSFRPQNPSLPITAVFIGGTSGLGLATLRSFAQHVSNPTAIVVGRSRARFEPELQALQQLNPNGKFEFVEHEIELLRDVDETSKLIAKVLDGRKIDLLYQSQGYISFAGREANADGLDKSISLRYHGRVRFTRDLLPHLSPNARVVSILAGTQEGPIFEDDLGLEKNYSVLNSMNHFSTLMTLSYDALASESGNQARTFIHAFPGVVSTGLLGKSATGVLGYLFRWVIEPLLGVFVAMKPEDVGERMLYYGTDDSFGKEGRAGKAITVDDRANVKENNVLKGYRERGFEKQILEEEARVWEKRA